MSLFQETKWEASRHEDTPRVFETFLEDFRDVYQGISALLQPADLRNGSWDRERPWDEILQHVFLYFFERLA